MVSPISITYVFNGDVSALNYVNAAALDTQLGNLATTVNAEIAERQRTIKDGAGLVDQSVRYRSLHPEVITSLAGLLFLQQVVVVTQAQITLSGLQVIDGYTTLANDRVLVMAQTASIENGIYSASAGVWTRTADASGTLTTSNAVYASTGTAGAGSTWRLASNATMGSTANTWLKIQETPTITVSRGGTGFYTYTIGDTLYADTASSLAKLSAVAIGSALVSNGVGVAPAWSASISLSGSVSSISPTAGVGYGVGAGGTVTQLTSKSTAVTLNKVSGTITLSSANLAALTSVGFTLTNSSIGVNDVPVFAIKSGATADSYVVQVDAVAAGSCRISLYNKSGSVLGEAVVLSFTLFKGVAS